MATGSARALQIQSVELSRTVSYSQHGCRRRGFNGDFRDTALRSPPARRTPLTIQWAEIFGSPKICERPPAC
jgi:hypothetical protein